MFDMKHREYYIAGKRRVSFIFRWPKKLYEIANLTVAILYCSNVVDITTKNNDHNQCIIFLFLSCPNLQRSKLKRGVQNNTLVVVIVCCGNIVDNITTI